MQNHFETFRTDAQRAPLAALSDVASQMWAAWGAGLVTDEQAAIVEGVIAARRAEQKPAQSLGAALVRTSIFPKRRTQRSPDRSASIERRRRLAYSGVMPSPLAARFSPGQLAVLRVVSNAFAEHGFCDLPIDAIASRAGVCRRVAQMAMRYAESDGLLTIQHRPVRGAKSQTNIVRIVSREWLAWLARGRSSIGCISISPTNSQRPIKGKKTAWNPAKEAFEGVKQDRGRGLARSRGASRG